MKQLASLPANENPYNPVYKFWHRVRAQCLCGSNPPFLDLGDLRVGCCFSFPKVKPFFSKHDFEFTFGKGAAFFVRFENTVVLLLKYK